METAVNIVKALRCSSMVHPADDKLECESCPYWEYQGHPDRPEEFWYSCNCDRICMDAAELIERLI